MEMSCPPRNVTLISLSAEFFVSEWVTVTFSVQWHASPCSRWWMTWPECSMHALMWCSWCVLFCTEMVKLRQYSNRISLLLQKLRCGVRGYSTGWGWLFWSLFIFFAVLFFSQAGVGHDIVPHGISILLLTEPFWSIPSSQQFWECPQRPSWMFMMHDNELESPL